MKQVATLNLLMTDRIALRKNGTGWEFASESVLEDFIWSRLPQLFEVKPLARQLSVNGEVSDIVGVDGQGSLMILELKNVEDRNVVQQVTRYYANLLQEKPFRDQIEYQRPARLVVISPSFHRHNLIDREYHKLPIEFFKIQVGKADDQFLLQLVSDHHPIIQTEIPYQEIDHSDLLENMPPLPKKLQDALGSCTPAEQQQWLQWRVRLLTFDPRLKEMVEATNITYGSGKRRLCAEIRFTNKPLKPVLFLWLPDSRYNSLLTNRKQVSGRMRIWYNDQNITHLGYVPEGMGTMKLLTEWETKLKPEWKWERDHEVVFHFGNDRYMSGKHVMQMTLRRDGALNSHIPFEVEKYFRCWAKQETPIWGLQIYPGCRPPLPRYVDNFQMPNFWDLLSDLALKTWLNRPS
jgi:RecB family endonuclease NucS